MDITMPQLGETVTEGTITRWFKAVGETVVADEPLFEVSTDKVDSEVPAPGAGVLTAILVPEGETVVVGTVLATLGDAGSVVAAPEPVVPEPVVPEPVVPEPVAPSLIPEAATPTPVVQAPVVSAGAPAAAPVASAPVANTPSSSFVANIARICASLQSVTGQNG